MSKPGSSKTLRVWLGIGANFCTIAVTVVPLALWVSSLSETLKESEWSTFKPEFMSRADFFDMSKYLDPSSEGFARRLGDTVLEARYVLKLDPKVFEAQNVSFDLKLPVWRGEEVNPVATDFADRTFQSTVVIAINNSAIGGVVSVLSKSGQNWVSVKMFDENGKLATNLTGAKLAERFGSGTDLVIEAWVSYIVKEWTT